MIFAPFQTGLDMTRVIPLLQAWLSMGWASYALNQHRLRIDESFPSPSATPGTLGTVTFSEGGNFRKHCHRFLRKLARRRFAREHHTIRSIQKAFATSVASARVGRRLEVIDSSIWVVVMTDLPARFALATSCFCTSTPRSPRAISGTIFGPPCVVVACTNSTMEFFAGRHSTTAADLGREQLLRRRPEQPSENR
jgi:hypothetical protein